ncbi:Xylose isomerase-like TIM barrel [Hartmannibacter diazotrophicus]|uniref:Xylose isomerase-like TIM barrel n=1 Tax=Hartmannibacter diazotrophicus TaxID=1482074 RepID=A0A2C9D8H4_9HYPH|nr:TIM barrel protein [Hartmannibacter diazotrophicus]SON56543.1 Xylose isomerase-like TIM barrel [Hartmannibacter diazotrophicus]
MTVTLPVIGACLPVETIAEYRDWLFEKDRDLELQSFHKAEVLNGDWTPIADEAKRLLDGHKGRIGIHGPFWGFTINSLDPDVRRLVERRLMQGLDVCDYIKGTHMVVHSPLTAWDYNNSGNYADSWSPVLEATHDTMKAVVRRAEDLGVALVIENIDDVDPSRRRLLVESFQSDAVRLSVDTGHAHYAHGSNGAAPVDYFVKDAGALLEHVHLQDADGYADRHWGIGEGTIRWHAVFRAIAELPQKPRLVLELRDAAKIPSSMEFIAENGLGQ